MSFCQAGNVGPTESKLCFYNKLSLNTVSGEQNMRGLIRKAQQISSTPSPNPLVPYHVRGNTILFTPTVYSVGINIKAVCMYEYSVFIWKGIL